MLGHPAGAEEDADADAGQALQALEVEEEEEVGKVRGHFQELGEKNIGENEQRRTDSEGDSPSC
jgi:hypothetical protein